jgi:hypothetical protein
LVFFLDDLVRCNEKHGPDKTLNPHDELGDALILGAAYLHGASLRVKRTNFAMYELMIQRRPWRRLDAPPPLPNFWATISNGEGRGARGRGWDGGAWRILRGLVEKMTMGSGPRG